jgi:hypothetical protein
MWKDNTAVDPKEIVVMVWMTGFNWLRIRFKDKYFSTQE